MRQAVEVELLQNHGSSDNRLQGLTSYRLPATSYRLVRCRLNPAQRGVRMSLSRRNFIKSVIAGGAVTSSAGYLFRSSGVLGQTSTAPGSVERLITLNVNGQMRRVDVLKQETLGMTLRYKLGLTGTKLGCDRAECGACSVLIDNVPHYSCSVLTHTVRGR